MSKAKAMMLVLNCRKRTVSFFEEALLVHDLHEKEGLSLAKIGWLLGRRKGWVSKGLSLIKRLDPEIRPFLQHGSLGPRAGYQISRLSRDLQMTVFVSSRSQNLTVSETESIVSMILALPQEDRLQAARDPRVLLSHSEVGGVSPGNALRPAGQTHLDAIGEATETLRRLREAIQSGSLEKGPSHLGVNFLETTPVFQLQRPFLRCQELRLKPTHLAGGGRVAPKERLLYQLSQLIQTR